MPSTVKASICALSADTANQIQSAFEVPSPLAIVQELVKNATDAGATKITVQLSAKSLDSITVADNGAGIAEESLYLLAKRGYTSKSNPLSGGNALAAITAVSAQLQICTRTQESLVACQLDVNSDGNIFSRKYAARDQGTTVTVVQPLCKLPVRYNLIKAQSTRIKTSIREWLVAYCLANYTIGITLAHTGMTKGPRESKNIVSFAGAPSLNDAVLHFIGAKRRNAMLSIEYYNKNAASAGQALNTHKHMKGIAYEGTFTRIDGDAFEVRNLPRLLLSINGTACKPDVLSGLIEQLQKVYPTEQYNVQRLSGPFLGALNVTIPLSKLDTSSKTPWLLCQFVAETIASEVAQSILLADAQSKKSTPPISMRQWSRGQCNIGTPAVVHCPAVKRKAATAVDIPDTSISTESPNKHPRELPIEDGCKLLGPKEAKVPNARWDTCSGQTSGLFADGSVGEIVCLVLENGAVCVPSSQTEAYADPMAHSILCIACTSGTLVALDTRELDLKLLVTVSGSVQLYALESRTCILSDPST